MEYRCYFWVDGEEGDKNAVIRTMCEECHDTKYGYLGWLYEGFLGKWKYVCSKCGKVIKE